MFFFNQNYVLKMHLSIEKELFQDQNSKIRHANSISISVLPLYDVWL